MNSVRCGNCQHHFSEAEPVDCIIIKTMTGWKRTLNLGVAGASEGVSLPPCAQVSLLVVLVGPHLVPPVLHVLTRCPDSSGLPHLLALKLIRSKWGECDPKDSVRHTCSGPDEHYIAMFAKMIVLISSCPRNGNRALLSHKKNWNSVRHVNHKVFCGAVTWFGGACAVCGPSNLERGIVISASPADVKTINASHTSIKTLCWQGSTISRFSTKIISFLVISISTRPSKQCKSLIWIQIFVFPVLIY